MSGGNFRYAVSHYTKNGYTYFMHRRDLESNVRNEVSFTTINTTRDGKLEINRVDVLVKSVLLLLIKLK